MLIYGNFPDPLKWYENRFTIRCSRRCIIHTRFEVRCVPVILENVLHNQNVRVRYMKNSLRVSKVKFLAKNPSILSLKLCQASEYSVMLFEFLAKTLTSDACRKLFMSRTHTFWVCKTFSYIRQIQRILNHDRATNETFFTEGKVAFEWILKIYVSETDLPSFRIFCHFVWVFGKDFDFRRA